MREIHASDFVVVGKWRFSDAMSRHFGFKTAKFKTPPISSVFKEARRLKSAYVLLLFSTGHVVFKLCDFEPKM